MNFSIAKEKERVYLWDNMKFLLINLVVIGHFADQYVDKSVDLRSLFFFIYIFHMPLFIFITGLFSKSAINGERFKIEKVIAYFLLYAIIKICFYYADTTWMDENHDFSLFSSKGVPWYLFACGIWLCMTYLIRDLKPLVVLAISVVLAIFVGYDDSIKDILCASRVMVYYPFFLLGYYMKQERIVKVVKRYKWTKFLAISILVGTLIYVFQNIEALYDFRPLLTGRNPYEELDNAQYGFIYRVMYYIVVVILSTSIIAITPKKKIPFVSRFGSRTLQVYFIHYFVLYILYNHKVGQLLCQLSPNHWEGIYVLLAIVTAFILSFKVFEYPFQKILKLSVGWAYRGK